MRRIYVGSALVALFSLVVFTVLIGSGASSAATSTITISTAAGASHDFSVELAVTPSERAQGLMNRTELDPDSGMLFDFGEARPVTMWMRDTPLSLDMLFVGDDGTILKIAENTKPQSDDLIYSGDDVRYVLEINGGRSAALGIAKGDRLSGEAIRPASE
ncbi:MULTISPECIES: DUF192 domain-containing protein [unclassified Ciceribacter]|uniref:DUF192 domain-containing protein n=1 Tax=unclassified Ciceribacter TaxID=2628820 RepID=UPI001FEF76A5|nr:MULTISPECIES: DUF192 domain-containing protein [unclassified Ciceribacter]